MQGRQEQQKFHHDHHARSRNFKCDDLVRVRNFSQGPMWIPGVVIRVRRPVLYTVELANGEQKCRYVDHLSLRVEKAEESMPDWADAIPSEAAILQPSVDKPRGNNSIPAPLTLRRSSQIRQAPECFGQ